MAKVKKRYVYRPEGCNPGRGCLACRLSDCTFSGRVFPEENKMLVCGEPASGRGKHSKRKGASS